jgi:Protein of unknown function (DUF3455)
MSIHARLCLLATILTVLAAASGASAQKVPDAVAAQDETIVLQVHAEGAMIYECREQPNGRLVWEFREPVATLMRDDKTVGRHYLGPTFELGDGSVVVGKVIARAPGTGTDDVQLLKLDVIAHRGTGELSAVTAIQRLDTVGGAVEGPCDEEGDFQSEPYAADYVFLRKN